MFLFISWAKLQPFLLVHPGLASISTSQLHCMPEFLTVFVPSSTFFHIYIKSTATQTYHRNFMLVVIFSGRNSKICHGRARYSSVVESQSYFVSDCPTFFPIPWATSQIPKQVASPYSLLWERGLLAIVTPTDAHQAATKDEKWLLSYQNRMQTKLQLSLIAQRSKVTIAEWCFQKTKASSVLDQNSSTFHGNPRYGVTKSYGLFNLYVENHSKT